MTKFFLWLITSAVYLVLLFGLVSFVTGTFGWIRGSEWVFTRIAFCMLGILGIFMICDLTDNTPTGEGR